jgi:hypothetical protein
MSHNTMLRVQQLLGGGISLGLVVVNSFILRHNERSSDIADDTSKFRSKEMKITRPKVCLIS